MNIEVPTISRPNCLLCNNNGIIIYTDLHDRHFNISGKWTIKKCPRDCNIYWIDPMPRPEHLAMLYQNYTNHAPLKIISYAQSNTLSNLIRQAYLYHQYGYGDKPTPLINFLRIIVYIYLPWKNMSDMSIFYIPKKINGVFLDIGCGNGSALHAMHEHGWQVHGIDFDERAIKASRALGFSVRQGDLLAQQYPDNMFDAILLCNVIEHLPNPQEIITECFRILKKDGILSIITPNMNGFGSCIFQKNWRGLETPQHLQLFTIKSLTSIIKTAGFRKIHILTSPHSDTYIFEQSLLLQKHDTISATTSVVGKTWRRIFMLIANYTNLLFNHSETIVCVVQKTTF